MFEFTGETTSRTITKRITESAGAETLFRCGGGLMATKQKSVDSPEQSARRKALADNCSGIFAGMTNQQVHQVFEDMVPHYKTSIQAVESLRRSDEAPQSKSRTVTALAKMLQCDEDELFKPDVWRRRERWIDDDGRLLPLPSEGKIAVAASTKAVLGIDSPAARDLYSMTPLFQKAIHAKPAEVVETCEQIVDTEYRHLFAYFVYWMQDQTSRG